MSKEMRTVGIFAGIFAVLAMVAGYFVNDTMTQVDQKKTEIEALNGEIASLDKEAKQHDALVEELDSLRQNFAQYVKILPSPEVATQERLMELLQEKSERAQFTASRFTLKEAADKAAKGRGGGGGGFLEIDVTLSAEATYEQFLRFLNSLERHESFLRVNSFSCSAASRAVVDAEGRETWPLTIALNISTFRYESGGK